MKQKTAEKLDKAPPRATPAAKPQRKGVVYTLVHGGASLNNPAKMVAVLNTGLPVSELDALQQSLQIPMEKLADLLGISRSTLHRRRKSGLPLDTDQSDRIVRYARLMNRAIEVLESKDQARLWLSTPQTALGGAVPLDFAETEVGGREVEDLLGRIEHSVYA